MIRIILPAFVLILASNVLLAQTTSKEDPSDALFNPKSPILTFRITVDEDNLKLLRKDPRKYVRCTVRAGGETYRDVAIHIKGAAGSSRGWDDKPALTLNFDKFVNNQNIKGLDKIHLNNSVQDGSYLSEIICSELSLKMGLPTARAGQTMVELNGRKVGLYVIKEGYNTKFIKRYFPGTDGNLYDGGFLTDINGDLKYDHGEGKREDLKAIVKACNERDPKVRFEAVSKLVDVDRFYVNAAVQIIGTDWDGYIRKPNNYRVYIPKDGKAVFIPHGMDQMFQNPGEQLWHGWGGMVARAILNAPEGKAKTAATIKTMMEKHMKLDELNKHIDDYVNRAKPALTEVNAGWAKNMENEAKGMKERLKQRSEYVTKELPKLK